MRIRRFVPLILCCSLVAGLVVASPASGAVPYSLEQIVKPAADSYFGGAVDISGDTAVVGRGSGVATGQARVYVRSGDTWALQQTLDVPGDEVDYFGGSVAIDGDTIVVGAEFYNGYRGNAYVYVRSGGTWTLQQELLLTGNPNDFYGYDVAIDGDWIVVGAPNADWPEVSPTINDAGTASVFHRVGTTWTRTELLTSDDPADTEYFGSAVGIDNGIIVVGAPYANISTNLQQGETHYWTLSGDDWTYGGSFTTGGQYGYHGQYLAMSGSTVIERGSGGPWVWHFTGTDWESQGTLRPADTPSGFYGIPMDICGDTAIVGYADKDVGASALQGAAYLFTRTGSTWTEQKTFLASDGAAGDNFGLAVAVGPTAVVIGAPQAVLQSGAAYFYSTPTPPVLTPIFRFYNVKNGTHFYTDSAAERDHVIATWPTIYSYEGPAYYTNPANNTQPLTRLYNKVSGSHFYTASPAEAATALAKWPTVFSLDGPTYAVNPAPVANSDPVFRFYNLKNGSHFYTASEDERNTVMAKWPTIYSYEGPAFWIGQ